MSVNAIGRTAYPMQEYNVRGAKSYRAVKTYAGKTEHTVQKSQMASGAFELHISNETDGRAVGAVCGTDYSMTAYEPNDFDPKNPVYKVKVWDKDGNVTERMVDLSKVDPKNSDYIDMFAYSGYLTSSGKCPNAQSEFIHAAANQHGPDERVYNDLYEVEDWIGIVKYAMQQQYDVGNHQGYMDYKRFWDFLMKESR